MNNSYQSTHLKKEVLTRIVQAFFSDSFSENTHYIPYDMRPKGAEVPFRCCIHKERAVLRDRAIAGLGFSIEEDDDRTLLMDYAKKSLEREQPAEQVLTVLDEACKGCVGGKIFVTDLCQGCVARPCESTCKFGAVSIVNGRSVIDSSKCKRCKMCISVCPYSAIAQIKVPCEDACPVGAIAKNDLGLAQIDFDKCISCGKCVASCPFGAVHEKSQLVDIMKYIKSETQIVAMIAPSIVGQFPCNIYQLKTALLQGGFTDVYEVAEGADITTKNEAKEFNERMEKGDEFMTTSCCAGYNQFIKKHLPEIKPFVSDTKTPLYYTAKLVKQKYPEAKIVFVSPCVAKRSEVQENPNVDYVMNYEELSAYFDGRGINVSLCEETPFATECSKQGRTFGVSGGVAAAVKKASVCEDCVQPCYINGLSKETIKELKKYAKEGKCENGNLVEVMCCEGGCIGGNATLNSPKFAAKTLAGFVKDGKDIDKIGE